MGSKGEKFNIAIAILEKLTVWASKVFSNFGCTNIFFLVDCNDTEK